MMFLPAATADTILLATPAPYPSLSLLAFATEGTGSMNVKVRFTDGSSQSFNGIAVDDWFATVTNTVIVGFDRVTRPTGIPNYTNINPKMYFYDLNLSCANRLKSVAKVILQSTLTDPRICVMALAGAVAAAYSVITLPVTCAGGNNGTAALTITGGVPPFTYNWATTPAQSSATANLPAGITNYTVTDQSACTYTSSVNIAQAIVPNNTVFVSASQNPVCSGSTITLTTGGANSYTWSSGGNTSNTSVI